MTIQFRSGTRGRFTVASLLLAGCLLHGPAAHAQAPPAALDEKLLAQIEMTFLGNSKVEWAALKAKGETVVPYMAHFLTDPDPDPVADRLALQALTFAREELTRYDCKSLVEPTLGRLKQDNRLLRAEAMNLLQKIGSKEDCVPIAVLLSAEDKRDRVGAAACLAKLGGKRELLALDLWLGDKTRQKDEAFDVVKKCRDELRTKVDEEEKKRKAKAAEKKDK